MTKQVKVFYVATCGLRTSIDEVLTQNEYFTRPVEDFLPNLNWFSVALKDGNDREEWVRAYNNMLEGQWTPNQTPNDRDYFAKQIEEAKKKMSE